MNTRIFRNLEKQRQLPEQLILMQVTRRRVPTVHYQLDEEPCQFSPKTNQPKTHQLK